VRELVHLTPADARRVPWKSGLGVTEELAVWPPGAAFEAGDFDWRISKAAVVEDGPFSPFPGFDRILVVLSGDGLRLEHGEESPPAELRPLEPYSFAGDWQTSATLLGGRVEDFNLIVRRGRVTGDVRVLRLGAGQQRVPLRAGHCFVHVLEGEGDVGPGHSLWARDAHEGDELELDGPCTVLLATLV
jgi:environmental stress-induced protein Ves